MFFSRTQTILAGLIFLMRSAPAESIPAQTPAGDCVVLLHGLGRSACSMKKLERTLAKENYRVVNLSYPSTRLSIEEAADWLGEMLKGTQFSSRTGQVHVVTHSLGGIVLRQCLATGKMRNPGRVVMLGPPNQGSELADKLKANRLYKFFVGPAGQQLGTDAASVPLRLPPADFELGIIAGDRSLNPFFSICFPGPNDGKVTVERTKLAGMKDFLVVHRSHTWLAQSRGVNAAVVRFLECGQFAPAF